MNSSAACDQIELGLIVQQELAPLQCLMQLGFELDALGGRIVHGGAEELEIATAIVFGRIHGRIGALEQCLCTGAVFRVARNADAGRDEQLLALQQEWRRQRIDDAGAQRADVAVFHDVGQDQGEFVPTQPRDQVAWPGTCLQALGGQHQQLVTDAMPQHVVDFLEVVQVDEHDARAARLCGGCADGQVERLGQVAPVRQVGQGVILRQIGQTLLGRVALDRGGQDVRDAAQEVAVVRAELAGVVREYAQHAKRAFRTNHAGIDAAAHLVGGADGCEQRAQQVGRLLLRHRPQRAVKGEPGGRGEGAASRADHQ
jgi:hypothetical protein